MDQLYQISVAILYTCLWQVTQNYDIRIQRKKDMNDYNDLTLWTPSVDKSRHT